MSKAIAIAALMLAAWVQAAPATAEDLQGSWTMAPTREAGKVHFGIFHRREGNNINSENDWPVSAFQDLDLATSARHDVKFVIARDAGRFDCEGYLDAGNGAGPFRFSPDAQYAKSMAAIGFTGVEENKQFAMAIHDVSLDYARQMKAEKLANLDTDKLLAFRIFDVTSQFIREMRAAGLPANDADKLIAYRVHGVSPAFIADLRRAGIQADEDQVIAFRIHGVTPEYVAKVQGLGYGRPEADQLIAMRVHGVTPEFIAEMKSRGLKDLTIDKLVALRIHGID
jgi:hypothetical protein